MSDYDYLKSRREFVKDATMLAGAAFASGIRPVSVNAQNLSSQAGWFEDVYRLFHIDAHFGGFKEVYKNFDAEAAAQMFDEAGVQMLSYFAKCLSGYSYYPTKIGVVHPGLDRDFTGEFTAALKKRGIRRLLYFFMAVDRNYQKTNPEWIYNTTPGNQVSPESKNSSAIMCFNSPYVKEVGIPQMKEILSLYDIDGFFIDIVVQQYLSTNCYCKSCRELFSKEIGGKIPESVNDSNIFAYRKWMNSHLEQNIETIQTEIEKVQPGISVIINYAWMSRYPVTPPKFVKHVTWDTPTPKMGLYSLDFSFESRYLSTIPDITWSCMNTLSNNWGDYSLREEEALLQECAIVLGSCGRTYLADVAYASGNPVKAMVKTSNIVNKRTETLEPFLKNSSPVKDTVLLHSADSVWSKSPLRPSSDWKPAPAYHSVNGAVKSLVDGHVQVAVINSDLFLEKLTDYKALILTDQRILSEKECEAIRNFVKNGGVLFADGETGTRDNNNKPMNNFSIADVLGVDYLGSSETSCSYLRVTSKIEPENIPAMDIQVVGNYTKIKPVTAKVLLNLVPPYENIKGSIQPPAINSEGPGVTINEYGKGKAIYCAAQLFTAYYTESTPVLRKLALWLFGQIHPNTSRSIHLENTPVNVEMFYNERGKERFVHLINFSGDKREAGTPQLQDFPLIQGIKVKIKLNNKPEEIISIPDGKKITFDYEKGFTSFKAEPLKIHNIYRIV